MPETEPEWVEMLHPKLGDDSRGPDGTYARVTRQAFDEVWRDQGWTEVGAATAKTTSKKGN